MSIPCRPFFRWGYDSESEYTFMYPHAPWIFGRGGVGGSDTAASGIQVAYKIRRDRIVYLTLLVDETERPVLETMLDWMQDSASPFDFRFDAELPESEHRVVLESCRWEDGPKRYPRRSGYPGAFEVEMALRTDLGDDWNDSASWLLLATEEA